MSEKIFVGLDNYVAVLTSDNLPRGHYQHGDLDGLSPPLFSFLLGLGAALALNREFLGRGVAARAFCSSPT